MCQQYKFRPIPLTLALFALLLNQTVTAELYRWTDEEGNVHYSDRLPPDAAKTERTELSTEGVPIRTIERPKTEEEFLREQELERLRKEQAELVEKQRAADQALLRTYRSVDDLVMVRDGKLAAIDVMIQSSKGNIRRQQNRLNRLQSDAADLERAGKPMHPALERDIEAMHSGIQNDLAAILRYERSKQDVYEKFADELERFRRLNDIQTPPEATAMQRPELDNLIVCTHSRQCDVLWGLAVAYVEKQATVPIESMSDHIVMTSPPKDEDDISLIVSRIADPETGQVVIFLDLQCQSYTAAATSCRTPKRLAILKQFRTALNSAQ
jgi:hypothetical protein